MNISEGNRTSSVNITVGASFEEKGAVAIVGMGKTGQAVARFLIHRGIRCEAFDEHPVNIPDSLHLPMHIGPLDDRLLATYARVIVSPGIHWDHPALCAVRDTQVPVSGDLDLFREHYTGDLIGITGTNGKTTTVSLISTMLDVLPGGIEAGGNIGRPMMQLLDESDMPHRVVLELSSFQLERANPVHPNWAALLNVQPDHADMHASSHAYEAAKLRLFTDQGEGDKAMLPADHHWNPLARKLAAHGVFVRRFGLGSPETLDAGVQHLDNGTWQVFWHHYDRAETVLSDDLPSRGQHQHLNLAVAAQAATDFGISASVIRQSLTSFRGLPHRMQLLGIVAGREWYNDSKATNPDAARAALQSFHQVVWICGGLRKELDVSILRETVSRHVEHVFIVGNDPKPFTDLAFSAGVSFAIVKTMAQAVKQAMQVQSGIPVLLSPAAASQDQFRNYRERGAAFADAVRKLEKSV